MAKSLGVCVNNGGIMAKSLGGAMKEGLPIVFTAKDRIPEVWCRKDNRAEALELLDKMKLITIVEMPEQAANAVDYGTFTVTKIK